LTHHLLFIRIAAVNVKGSILSDFHIINRSLVSHQHTSPIDQFQCRFDDNKQQLTIEWSTDYESRFYIHEYVLYYSDRTENTDEFIRQLIIPIHQLTVRQQQSYDFYRYEINRTQLDLNYHRYHILRLHLSVIDHNHNQLSMTQPGIYCSLTRKYGKKMLIIHVFDR
jgi:hypothetical protein